MTGLVQTLRQHRELLWTLTSRELKLRYRGSVLGFLWSILIPLFMAAIYIVFLRLLGGRGVPLGDVIIGVFAWQYTVQCVNSGLSSISGNANLVKKVYFPRAILPLSCTLANLITYLLSLVVQFPILLALFAVEGHSFSGWIVLLPAVILLHTLFNLGLSFLLAAINVSIRDAQHLVGILLSAWFFVSPVMYNLSFVQHVADKAPWAPHVFLLNPLAVLLTGYRAAITSGVAFPWEAASIVSIALMLAFSLWAYRVFDRLQKDFADSL